MQLMSIPAILSFFAPLADTASGSAATITAATMVIGIALANFQPSLFSALVNLWIFFDMGKPFVRAARAWRPERLILLPLRIAPASDVLLRAQRYASRSRRRTNRRRVLVRLLPYRRSLARDPF